MVQYIPSLLGLTGLGLFFALPVLIPPVRRWLRRGSGRRLTAVFSLSLLLIVSIYLVISFLGAELQSYFICYPSPHSTDTCTDEIAVRFRFMSSYAMKAAMRKELFLRAITPSPFRQDCYHDNLGFCDFVKRPFAEGSLFNDGFGYFVLLWPSFVTGALAWWWTQPKNERKA